MTMTRSFCLLCTLNFRQVERQSATDTRGFSMQLGLKKQNYLLPERLVMRPYSFSLIKSLAPLEGKKEPFRSIVTSSFVTPKLWPKNFSTARSTFLKIKTVLGPSWLTELFRVSQSKVCPSPFLLTLMCLIVTSKAVVLWICDIKANLVLAST